MTRSLRWVPFLLVLPWAGVSAQPYYRYGYGGATTPQGDYLRGVGIEAAGMGVYNYDTAVAESINTDTYMRWNNYVSAVSDYHSQRYAAKRDRAQRERNQHLRAIQDRIRNHPEERDVQVGSSLNDLMMQLLDPAISDSSFRFDPVPLSADIVRRIPFKLDKENLVFSMHRLTATGKEKWPPALQDPAFDSERRAYERALDAVLEQQAEGKMKIDAIRTVEAAVDGLYRKLDQVLTPSKEKLYLEAKNRLNEFKKTASQLLQSHQMELVIGQLDRYSGTTVRDLLKFMQGNKLGFAGAESPEEKKIYPELYTTLKTELERLKDGAANPAR